MADDTVSIELKTEHALLVAFVVGVFAGGFFVSAVSGLSLSGPAVQDTGSDTADTGDDNPSPSPSGDSGGENDIPIDGEPVLGDANAPVTLIAYEDFECPFCQRFEQDAMAQIKSNYVDSGQVKVVWKDFPLTNLHPWAKSAAVAMECVYRQDESAFWTVNEKIFDNQDSISQGSAQDQIKQWASAEGVSESAVQSCIDSGDATSEVEQDMSEGRNNGVSGTPTVFINGQKIVGAQPYGNFEQAIESALGN